MAFTKLEGYSKLIADLSDYPNEGMSALELKRYWDSSPEEARQAINRLIDELTISSASGKIGAASIQGLNGSTVQALIQSLKDYVDSHRNHRNNPHGVTAAQLNVYTKEELIPYLQGGDTIIVEEVFYILNADNGNGTFTYRNENNESVIGELTAEGHQVFTFANGVYNVGLNRVECIVGDTLRRSVKSGGLAEISNNQVALTIPEGNGAEITFRYFQRVGVTGEHNVVISDTAPPKTTQGTVWFKVVT